MMKSTKVFELNFWPGIADMILAIFMTFLILWVAEMVQSIEVATSDQQKITTLEKEKEDFLKDKPPLIQLPHAKGYEFESGRAKRSQKFVDTWATEARDRVKNIFNNYKVDVVEIIGHTDGQKATGKQSNLDEQLENAVAEGFKSGKEDTVEKLSFGSNADLGLMRALSVAIFLNTEIPKIAPGKKITFRIYSAAQLILPSGELAYEVNRNPDDTRRRIELRFTKLEASK